MQHTSRDGQAGSEMTGPRFTLELIRERAVYSDDCRRELGLPYADSDIYQLLAEVDRLTSWIKSIYPLQDVEHQTLDAATPPAPLPPPPEGTPHAARPSREATDPSLAEKRLDRRTYEGQAYKSLDRRSHE